MRFFSLFLSVLLLSSVLVAGTNPQKRYLVSTNAEVIPLSPEESAVLVMKNKTRVTTGSSVCPDKFTFGYRDVVGTGSNFGAYYKDVMGEWFTVPATGTIDSVYWTHTANAGAYDSLIFVRIHNSNITPTNGPGRGIYVDYPPCRSWGYWPNTNDPDQAVAAFVEEATGAWISTINPLGVETPPPAAIPFGSELWGFGGFPVSIHPNETIGIAMADLSAPIPVTAGSNFFLSMRMNHEPSVPVIDPYPNPPEITSQRTGFAAVGFQVPTTSIDYPARNWKFYEFPKGPSPECFGTPRDEISKGWVVRGPLSSGENTAAYRFWYVMSVSSNVPPNILEFTSVPPTFTPGPQTVTAEIEDCNPAGPAGVAYAKIQYFVDDVAQPDIVMDNIGGTTYEGVIPSYPVGSHIVYQIYAVDIDSASAYATGGDYSILQFGSEWYTIDTAVVCVKQDIRSTGTTVDPLDLFTPPYSTSGSAPGDDGGWGPVDIGGNFTFFGEAFRYAWIGTNGAITLTASATDTMDPNANGFYSNFNLPQSPVWHGRGDTADAGGMPRAFISPFWADHIIAEIDTNGVVTTGFGRIVYGDNGDPCQFIVEWDSIGTFDANGSAQDETTFRVILNRCDGTIEYQYNSVGLNGLDSAALVGMQLDTDSAGVEESYVFLNRNTYPYETKPRNGWCVKFTPTTGAEVIDGWNIVSVPSDPDDANYAKAHLYPQATSAAFAYTTGYVAADPLSVGPGYWMKFSGAQRAGGVASSWNASEVISVNTGWNIMGSISGPVAVGTITPGGTTVTSPYWGYSGAYYPATQIEPGQGYWVKTSGAGTLTLTYSAAIPKEAPKADLDLDGMNTITVRDAIGRTQTLYIGEDKNLSVSANYFEMPPAPPAGAFDVRFSVSQRLVETYPGKVEKAIEYPISIQSTAYPISVSWKMNGVESKKFEIVAAGKTSEMNTSGTKVIADKKVNTLIVRLTSDNTPKVFALSQNYPNPFNPVTRFRVDVAKTSPVEVAVFDILGRKIATLLSGEREAGSYTMEWNGKDDQGLTAPTGMYFIRMTAGEFTENRKVMLMK